MKILYVDDDPQTLDFLSETLHIHGFPNKKFTNPIEAINAYEREQYDVVITDFQMPQMSGIEVLKAIKTRNPLTKVVIFTAYMEAERIIEAFNNNIDGIFFKADGYKDLIKTLSRIEKEVSIVRELKEKIKKVRKILKLKNPTKIELKNKNEKHCIVLAENETTLLVDDILLKYYSNQ